MGEYNSIIESIEVVDKGLFLWLNSMHTPFVDDVMWFISGKLEWIPLYIFLVYLVIKKYGIQSWKVIIGVVVVIALSDQSSVHLFKNIFERYRPCHNLDIIDLVHRVNNKCGGKYGFVSSHAANSFALATYIGFLLKPFFKNAFKLLFVWATIVAYSRVYLGVHYPTDILGGAMLGILIGYVIYKLVSLKFIKSN